MPTSPQQPGIAVREAAFKDVRRCVRYLRDCHHTLSEKQALEPFSEGATRKMLAIATSNPRAYKVWIAEREGDIVGILVGITNPVWFSTAKQALDLFFYTSPEGRGAGAMMLRKYLRWARHVPGVMSVWITSTRPMDSRMRKMLARMGMTLAGENYSMVVERQGSLKATARGRPA